MDLTKRLKKAKKVFAEGKPVRAAMYLIGGLGGDGYGLLDTAYDCLVHPELVPGLLGDVEKYLNDDTASWVRS